MLLKHSVYRYARVLRRGLGNTQFISMECLCPQHFCFGLTLVISAGALALEGGVYSAALSLWEDFSLLILICVRTWTSVIFVPSSFILSFLPSLSLSLLLTKIRNGIFYGNYVMYSLAWWQLLCDSQGGRRCISEDDGSSDHRSSVGKVRTCLVHEVIVELEVRVLRPFHKPEGHILHSAFCSPDRELSGNLYSEQNRSRHHEVVKSWNFLFLDLCKLRCGNTPSTSFCKWGSHT